MSRADAMALAASIPNNQQVIDACRAAYHQHSDAVDEVTIGSVNTAQSSGQRGNISAMHQYNWNSRVAAPQLASPVYADPGMASAKAAVNSDGAFAVFFVGIQANVDVIVGVEGGVGVGFPISRAGNDEPIWLAYGGVRLSTNIDIGININTGIFIEPPAEIAGDYLGLEVSAEPVAEGPEVSFGLHMSPDLSTIRGFSFGIGVALSLIPVSGAVVSGKIVTTASGKTATVAAV